MTVAPQVDASVGAKLDAFGFEQVVLVFRSETI